MRRGVMLFVGAIAAVVVTGCVGDTDPATHIRATQAQLNAHGYTNNGPAVWWWEYSTAQNALGTGFAVQVCGNPPEADKRCGPASGGSQSNPVPLSVTVKGLKPSTTYYFRACGQDQNSSTQTCGRVLSFKTSPGDSSVWAGAFGLGYAKFTGATNIVHKDWRVTTSFLNGHIVMEEHEFAFPDIGGTIAPGVNCQTAVISGDPYDRAVDCQPGGITFFEAHFGPFGDQADSFGLNIPVLFFGEGGNDLLVGDTQNDTFYGGDDADQIAGNGGRDFVSGDAGIDNLFGGAGDDTVDARDGQFFDKVDCGADTDTAYVDFVSGIPDEYNYAASHGCETIFGSASAARAARTEQQARIERMRSR